MNRPRMPIVREVAMRLMASLVLLMVLIGGTTAVIYQRMQSKAGAERLQALEGFYLSRLEQIERQWEQQTSDVRVRIEYARILERASPLLADELRAFLIVQGGPREFAYLMINDADGRPIFSFGKALALQEIPALSNRDRGWYLDTRSEALYRVFTDNIWLGSRGAGRVATFYRVDNALLLGMASPGAQLSAWYGGQRAASSAGSAYRDDGAESALGLPWSGRQGSPTTLRVESLFQPSLSMVEMAVAVGLVPLIDGLIVWFFLGTWIMRGARRIGHLGDAVAAYARQPAPSDELRRRLECAAAGREDEISGVAGAIGTMAEENWRREQARQAEEVRAQEARLAGEVARRVIAAQEEERRRLAASLHDSTGAHMAAINFGLMGIGDALAAAQLAKPAARLDEVRRQLAAITANIREICSDLRPAILDDLGLAPAIRGYAQQFQTRTGIAVAVKAEEMVDLAPEMKSTAFRILQEALANCAKHSRSKRVEVALDGRAPGFRLSVSDDGVGFAPAELSGRGLGLATMRQRVALVGGRIDIESRPGLGTRVVVEV